MNGNFEEIWTCSKSFPQSFTALILYDHSVSSPPLITNLASFDVINFIDNFIISNLISQWRWYVTCLLLYFSLIYLWFLYLLFNEQTKTRGSLRHRICLLPYLEKNKISFLAGPRGASPEDFIKSLIRMEFTCCVQLCLQTEQLCGEIVSFQIAFWDKVKVVNYIQPKKFFVGSSKLFTLLLGSQPNLLAANLLTKSP